MADDLNHRVRELVERFAASDANVAELLCDDRPPNAVAYTVVEPDLSSTVLTYGDLRERSERLASAFAGLGIGPSDCVATLMGKSPEYLVTLLAIWRVGAVHVPLFTAFAAPAVEMRIAASRTKLVVCDPDQLGKLATGSDGGPNTIVVTGDASADVATVRWNDLVEREPAGYRSHAVGGDGPMIQIYTSGTTGAPKGVVAPVRALASFQAYGEFGLDLRPHDTYWCAADPGWAYGLYFGILSSLTTATPSILVRAGFDAGLTWQVLASHAVTNFAAAPTVYRSLRASAPPTDIQLALRCASSAGEPLTPEVNEWAVGALGVEVHDHYGQTEAGMLLNNHHHPVLARPLKVGSMGHAMPGWRMTVLHADRDTEVERGHQGRIAADLTSSPLAWFKGYEGDAERSAEKFTADGRWYLTGDLGSVDEEGHFFFASREDDVIIMAGYRIGPFEVESVLASHPDVLECAAIAVPDDIRGEVLEAFVVLRPGVDGSDALGVELQKSVKEGLAAHAYPRAVHFTNELPKTPSGKIQRYLLKQQRVEQIAERS